MEGWLVNEQGFSFVETMLALVILFFLTSTLIPITYLMKQKMYDQTLRTNAAEVAYNGALSYKRYGEVNGMYEIDDTQYHWIYANNGICVTYVQHERLVEKCV